jgi:DME family drug/metabolite transporter
VFQWGFFAGAVKAGSSVASIMSTAIAPLASDVIERKRASGWARWLGLGCCALAWFGAGAHGADFIAAVGGGFASLLAGVAYAVYTDIAARIEQSSGAGVAVTALALLLASLSLLPAAWSALPAFASARGVVIALYLGLATTALAYGAFARGLGGVAASDALALLALQPLTAAALGWLILDEPHATPEVLALIALLGASASRLLAAKAPTAEP